MSARIHIDIASRIVRAGGIVAYPTEAVFGLGCLPENRHAVETILRIKRRSWRKGLLLIAADFEALEPYVLINESPCREEILDSWPGPHTWILPARPETPKWITGGRQSVGVRVTAHPVARELCRCCAGAIVSTSANVSRRPPTRTTLNTRRTLGQLVDYVLPGEVGSQANPTAIRDGRTGRLLRAS